MAVARAQTGMHNGCTPFGVRDSCFRGANVVQTVAGAVPVAKVATIVSRMSSKISATKAVARMRSKILASATLTLKEGAARATEEEAVLSASVIAQAAILRPDAEPLVAVGAVEGAVAVAAVEGAVAVAAVEGAVAQAVVACKNRFHELLLTGSSFRAVAREQRSQPPGNTANVPDKQRQQRQQRSSAIEWRAKGECSGLQPDADAHEGRSGCTAREGGMRGGGG
jgi:hypothetical protein